eukprot:597708-Pelagomonas_calceolata.AAC.3
MHTFSVPLSDRPRQGCTFLPRFLRNICEVWGINRLRWALFGQASRRGPAAPAHKIHLRNPYERPTPPWPNLAADGAGRISVAAWRSGEEGCTDRSVA